MSRITSLSFKVKHRKRRFPLVNVYYKMAVLVCFLASITALYVALVIATQLYSELLKATSVVFSLLTLKYYQQTL